jgi:hypothetical protein
MGNAIASSAHVSQRGGRVPTSRGEEWQCRLRLEASHRPWRGHSHLNQSICVPEATQCQLVQIYKAPGTHFLDFGEHVLMCRELAIETEEFLLLLGHGLQNLFMAASVSRLI